MTDSKDVTCLNGPRVTIEILRRVPNVSLRRRGGLCLRDVDGSCARLCGLLLPPAGLAGSSVKGRRRSCREGWPMIYLSLCSVILV